MACVSKIGSLYEMVTKNVIVSTTNTVFGINPRAWIALPCEGLILLKIRQVFFQYRARCDFNVSGFYFNSYCFILNLINS